MSTKFGTKITEHRSNTISSFVEDGVGKVTVRIRDDEEEWKRIDSWSISDKHAKIRKADGFMTMRFDIDPMQALHEFMLACPVTELFNEDNEFSAEIIEKCKRIAETNGLIVKHKERMNQDV